MVGFRATVRPMSFAAHGVQAYRTPQKGNDHARNAR